MYIAPQVTLVPRMTACRSNMIEYRVHMLQLSKQEHVMLLTSLRPLVALHEKVIRGDWQSRKQQTSLILSPQKYSFPQRFLWILFKSFPSQLD